MAARGWKSHATAALGAEILRRPGYVPRRRVAERTDRGWAFWSAHYGSDATRHLGSLTQVKFGPLLENGFIKIELINHAFVADEIDFAAIIGSEGGDPLRGRPNLADHVQGAIVLLEAPNAM